MGKHGNKTIFHYVTNKEINRKVIITGIESTIFQNSYNVLVFKQRSNLTYMGFSIM